MADLLCSIKDFLLCSIGTTKSCLNESFTVLLEEFPDSNVRNRRDLDELSKSISNLSFWQCAEECEVKEGDDGSMIGSKTVLQLAVVDGNLDGDSSINETNDCGRDADEVGVSAVRGACKTDDIGDLVAREKAGSAECSRFSFEDVSRPSALRQIDFAASSGRRSRQLRKRGGARDTSQDHVTYETTSAGEDGLLSDETKVGEGIYEGEHVVHGLWGGWKCLSDGMKKQRGRTPHLVDFTTGHDVDGQGNVMVLEVSFHLVGIVVVHNLVSDEEASLPLSIDVCEMGVLGVEDVVNELEA